MPFALDGEAGRVEVDAQGIRHKITFAVDPIRQEPVIQHECGPGLVKSGTRVTVRWPSSASSVLRDAEDHFLQILYDFVWLNPHLALGWKWFGETTTIEATDPVWQKWRPSDPTSAHWYETKHLKRLVAAYITHDEDRGRARTVREFVVEFRGFSGSAAQKRVLDATGLAREQLSALRAGDGLNHERVGKLLEEMRAASRPVKATQLGMIGEAHLNRLFRFLGCDMDTFQYKRVIAEGSLPWVLEAAFGYCPDDESYDEARVLVTGVNWSPGIGNPFKRIGRYGDGLDAILAQQRAGPREPVIVFLHLAHPRVEYTDRGKSAISFATIDPHSIFGLVDAVTAKWAKQRKAEERHASARLRREAALASRREERVTTKQAAYDAMPSAYMKASANDTLPAKARQVMYAARGTIQERTGKPLNDQHFCQMLLPDFMAEYPELTRDWKIVWDARGHLVEPHTQRTVPLGTLEVRDYLRSAREPVWSNPVASVPQLGTSGPSHRYGGLLFVEKEGFNELFRAVRLAEQFDIAILSTKGMSVTACRELVDEICSRYSIPLFVLHDFDKAGFSIAATLQRDTRRYKFQNQIEVVDLGLRLADVEEYGLERESVHGDDSAESVRANLRKNGATEKEIKFLLTHRVELNAFTSDAMVEWITAKLEQHGVEKVIPDEAVLAEAYRREHQSRYITKHFEELVDRSRQHVENLDIPADLQEQVAQLLQEQPALSWNDAVAEMTQTRPEWDGHVD
jgi:Topoisomerase 6 subunit A/Spo11, Toprim domain